ncbi:MAG: hypothetical protein JWP88_914, partial [Flaviaesturariibacter sp.]|nr:hypothetical protein [Flaviaesturariibacter sp.]
MLSLLALLCLTIAFIETEGGQNWLARQAVSRLSKDLQSRITIQKVRFSFFDKMNLQGVLIEDRKRDTLLYAGTVQVNITDWFFLKDKADLQYIGLKDAVIKLQRTVSIWNYAFLEDYFGSSGSSGKKESGLDFNLKKVVLENISFTSRDAWVGNDMYLRLASMNLDANDISLTRHVLIANSLTLKNPFFQQFSYNGRRPSKPKALSTSTVKKDLGLFWNPQNWLVSITKINIASGTYRNDKDGRTFSTKSFFDDRHIDFNQINGTIINARFQADTFSAHADLTTKERSGLIVQQLKTSLRFHPQLMDFSKLYLKTNRSILTDHLAMRFGSFSDLQDFIHSVRLDAHFDKTSLASDDIAFFAPQIKDWNRVFLLNGQVTGTVDALQGKGVNFRSGSTALTGNFSIDGLPDINSAYINVDANDLLTTYTDAATFIPTLRGVKMPNLRKLGAIRFRGTYTGFINDFVAYGTLQTALGSLKTDLNMKLPQNGEPVYSGSISTSSFQLGQFFNNSQLGIVDFHGNVKGKSFNWSKLDLTLNGTIHRIRYDNYTYQNITAKGRLNNKSFDGDFTIKDPNADLKLSGLITFDGSQPTFKVVADITKANLQALQLTKENLSLSGQFNLNFSGASFSNFLGTASISNAILLQDDKRLSFDSLVVSSNYLNGVRSFRAKSNEFDASVIGQFDLKSLPDAFTLFLNRYYPTYIRPPRQNIPNQSFTFDITTGAVEDYLKLVDKRLSGFNNSHVSGSLNVAANSLVLDADVPQFGYQQYRFSDVKLKADGNFDRLLVDGSVNNAVISDSVYFPQTSFTIQAKNDVSDIKINTTANQTINQANLSAQVKTFADGASILFNPSAFVLNGKTWTIEQGGELDFRRNSLPTGQVVLRESNQEVRLSTRPSDIGSWTDLHIALQNLNLGDIAPFLTKKQQIEGLLNGEIVVEDPQTRMRITSDLSTEQLRLNGDSIGQVKASIAYDKVSGALKGTGSNLDPEHQIKFDFDLDLDDSANVHKDLITIQPVNYPVKYLENFIGTLFTDLQGFVTGKLAISGEGANREFIGKARLHDAGLKVAFTQVFYRIDDTEIELQPDRINFGAMKLRDKDGKTATVKGSIFHSGFQNMRFDIAAEVDGEPMELLNTTYNDNQTFYGTAKGTGSFQLRGPQDAMEMYIEARPSETENSYITLPPSRSRETGIANFMVERKYGREMTSDDLKGSSSNINYVVNITANRMLNMEVVLDELTGDVIKGRGSGNLVIQSGTNEPLSIRGRYDIEEGSYLFTFQSFFKKPFVLRPGANNYIEWTGDPYAAKIKFEALYTAESVSFAPLINSLALTGTSSERIKRQRGDVNVVAVLTGELFSPTFSFKLDFPTNSPVYSDPSFAYGLQQIESNTNEINRQVTYLIVFNSFAPYQAGGQQSSYLNEFAYSTISGLFFGEVNKRLNQLLSKVLGNNQLTFNFTGSLYNANLIDQSAKGFKINQSTVTASVSAPLIKERVQITFGSSFDVPLPGASVQQTLQIFPDVSVDWLINESGSIRATFFYSQTPDLLLSSSSGSITNLVKNQRAGAKISYRKEFNSLSDFFRRKKAKVQNSTSVKP